MSVKILRTTLHVSSFEVQAFAFIPDVESLKEQWACFTHGYTSQKSDCLPWATRTAEGGIPTIIFDQPGHYLGSFNDVESFEDFKNNVHVKDGNNKYKRNMIYEVSSSYLMRKSEFDISSIIPNRIDKYDFEFSVKVLLKNFIKLKAM